MAHQSRLIDIDIQPWLHELGLRFDPFKHLEASTDPRLGDYVVGQKVFAIAWDDAPALVFAPAGGGKTAMRMYATRACWVGLGGAHPFPIPYTLSNHVAADHPPTPAAHLREIARAGARALLIGLLFRPERFMGLDAADQRAVVELLQGALPGPLPRYLEIAREPNGLSELLRRLEPSYQLSNPPNRTMLLALCDTLAAAIRAEIALPPPEAQFERLIALLRGPLGFGSVYIMVDALDAFPQTVHASATAMKWLGWMLEQAAAWAERRIFLKGFLPSETEQAFATQAPAVLGAVRHARLNWTVSLLAELIQRRVYMASSGDVGSLDAVCGPELRNVETVLIKALPARARQPREALVLVRRVLHEYVRRPGRVAGQLASDDIEAAIRWYRKQPIRPTVVPDG